MVAFLIAKGCSMFPGSYGSRKMRKGPGLLPSVLLFLLQYNYMAECHMFQPVLDGNSHHGLDMSVLRYHHIGSWRLHCAGKFVGLDVSFTRYQKPSPIRCLQFCLPPRETCNSIPFPFLILKETT